MPEFGGRKSLNSPNFELSRSFHGFLQLAVTIGIMLVVYHTVL